jgi:membrane protease YdiL (CAAX protease family)
VSQPALIRRASTSQSPWAFVVLVFVLAVPFYGMGAVTGLQLLPGIPVAGLAFVCPALAALILTRRANGAEGTTALLKRAFDRKRIRSKIWYLPILLLLPAASVLAFAVLRLTGTPVPAPQIAVLPTLLLCVGFFVGALGEELGWSGYAIDPMQDRWGALRASVLLGSVWAVWHYPGLLQAHRSLAWIAWWSVGTVAARVIMVWLYGNTGRSVFGAALFHMTINVTWQLFPVHGSYWDPRVSGLIMAATAALIAMLWKPGQQARPREAAGR